MASRNRGKPKPSLRDLSRVPPTNEEQKAIHEALRGNDSPIAVAVLGASLVEHELETELRAKFRRTDDDTWKELTSDIGPLGTFHQKIVAAYGLGILNEVHRDNLHIIRRIRNAFAHTKRLIDFDHDLVKRELAALSLPAAKKSDLYKFLASIRAVRGNPQTNYIILCLVTGRELLLRGTRRQKAQLARLRLKARRKAYADALRRTPATGGIGLLGLLGSYPPVDPKKTILGQAPLAAQDLESNADHKKGKKPKDR